MLITRIWLALALITASLSVAAQKAPRLHRVALLGLQPLAAGDQAFLIKALQDGLRELGYTQGRDLLLDFHTADGKPERLAEVAGSVVQLKYDVIYGVDVRRQTGRLGIVRPS